MAEDPNEREGIELLGARRRFGMAWVGLVAAVALHVADEASHDFLSVYNPTVEGLRERLGWFPMPTFEYERWLSGLMVGIVLLLVLSVFAFWGARVMVWFAVAFAVLMTLNGLGHIAATVYTGRMIAGVYSAPVLIAAALYTIVTAGKVRKAAWD